MKILVVITGGTIGSTTSGPYTCLDKSKNYSLIEHYKENYDKNTEFDVVSEYSILSENLTAKELNLLTECVEKSLDKGYDGVIVTHGTDTLQYTASALAYCFSNLSLPILLVSANYPLESKKSNGYHNFEAAVEFVRAKAGNGVFVSYKNKDEDKTNIHLATRVYSHLENTDEVYSIGNQVFAFYKNGLVTLNKEFIKTLSAKENTRYMFKNKTEILVISSMVGDSFNYSLDNVKAVLIRPYHSGTINTADGCLKAFCIRAKEQNIPVFILTAGLNAEYESTNAFEQFGIIPLRLSTFVSQYMKLWIATSNDLDIKEFMQKESAQEYIVNQ